MCQAVAALSDADKYSVFVFSVSFKYKYMLCAQIAVNVVDTSLLCVNFAKQVTILVWILLIKLIHTDSIRPDHSLTLRKFDKGNKIEHFKELQKHPNTLTYLLAFSMVLSFVKRGLQNSVSV